MLESKENLEIIRNGYSTNDVCTKIFGYTNGRVIKKLIKFIEENDIDITHFDDKNKNRKYKIVEKNCPICNDKFKTKLNHKNEKTTCSSSCSNKYFRSGKSIEEKMKISSSLKKYYDENPYNRRTSNKIYTRICNVCGEEFQRWRNKGNILTKSKSCSTECLNKNRSINSKIAITKRINNGTHKGWMSRNKLSYPERFFINVLKNNNIYSKCKVNYKISKNELGIECHSNYFLDFFFEEKMLDLEIDGKQHNIPERKESDELRDEYLSRNGITVYRIKWENINTKNGKKYIKNEINKFMKYYNTL